MMRVETMFRNMSLFFLLQQCWNAKMSVRCLALNQKRCFARHTLTATSTMELRLPPSRLLLVASLVACHRVRHRLRNDDRTAWESGRVFGGGGNVGSLLLYCTGLVVHMCVMRTPARERWPTFFGPTWPMARYDLMRNNDHQRCPYGRLTSLVPTYGY